MGQSSDETVFSKVGQLDQTTKQYAQRLLPLFEMMGIDVVRACVGVLVSGGGGGCGGFDGLTKREAILWLTLNILFICTLLDWLEVYFSFDIQCCCQVSSKWFFCS